MILPDYDRSDPLLPAGSSNKHEARVMLSVDAMNHSDPIQTKGMK
jgi:hypothetical protein